MKDYAYAALVVWGLHPETSSFTAPAAKALSTAAKALYVASGNMLAENAATVWEFSNEYKLAVQSATSFSNNANLVKGMGNVLTAPAKEYFRYGSNIRRHLRYGGTKRKCRRRNRRNTYKRA